MLKDIIAVEALSDHRLFLRFEDGVAGIVRLSDLVPFEGIFAPLATQASFQQVTVNHELGSIQWPNGADLDPDVLYGVLTGRAENSGAAMQGAGPDGKS